MPRNLVAITMRIPLRANGAETTILTSSAANPTVVTTAAPHELYTGERVTISRHQVAPINGEHAVTRISTTTFSIPVSVATGGTGGTARYAPPVDNRPGGAAARWGGARYPPFNELPIVAASGRDWAHYIDDVGIGWCYDASSGHRQGGATPVGQQEACLLVPAAFATQAIAAFGGAPWFVAAVTPAAFVTFHDTRAQIRAPDTRIDERIIKPIEIKIARQQALTQKEQDALDPDNTEPGIVRNRAKAWATRATDEDVVVVAHTG